MSSLWVPQMAAGDGLGGWDLFQQLLKKRIVFLGSAIDDSVANMVCAQLLLLAEDSDRDIAIYVNSPGGSVTAGLAIYDTMQYVPCDVSTVCRSEEHTSELQSPYVISYAVFCL